MRASDTVLLGASEGFTPPMNRIKRVSYVHFLLNRFARAAFVAIVLFVAIPMFMIHAFNLTAPDLYSCDQGVSEACGNAFRGYGSYGYGSSYGYYGDR